MPLVEPNAAQPESKLRRYGNPLYHLRKIQEDLAATFHSFRCRDLTGLSDCETIKAVRGRLFSAFFVAGGCSFVGPVTATALQFISRNYWVGLISTLIVSHSVATIAFQIAWWLQSKDWYRTIPKAKDRFLAMERDILPIQWQGFRWILTFAIVGIPIKAGIVLAFNTLWPQAVTFIPIPAILAMFDLIFVDCTFVRIMGDQFERHAETLARRYCFGRTTVRPAA